MTKEELENYADKYLIERFGAKTGNDSVRKALLDGYSLALRIHDVVGRSEKLKCGNQNPPCAPNLKFGMLECCNCDWSE
jgi:hypothetical protein